MTWAPGPVVTRRRLGGELKRLREQSGKKLDEVAKVLECSPSKISRLENGKGLPKWRDVRDLLDVYEVGRGETYDRLLEWAQTGQQPMWWSKYADVVPASMATYIELEWDAAAICAYEPYIVHGLLQTRDYARTVLRGAWGTALADEQVERLVDVRMQRQEALTADHGLTFTCVLDESTLYRAVGSPEIQRAQLVHLIGMAEAEHVEVRVLPFSAGLVSSGHDPFSVLEFGEEIHQVLAHVERYPSEGDLFSDPPTIEAYRSQWAALRSASLSERESVPLLEHAAMTPADRRTTPSG